MEETTSPVIPITIQPRNVFGLRTDVVGNVHFTIKQEVLYPVEGVLAFHDYVTKKQKFLRFPDNTVPSIIAMSPNRKLLAVCELFDGVKYSVIIYDLLTLKKRKNLQLPNGVTMPPLESICFTNDSKGVALLTNPPDEMLILFLFDKAETVVQGKAANTNMRGIAQCISCNPNDSGLIAVGGENVFKLMARSEKGFSLSGNLKCEGITICSLTWVSVDMLVAGTNKGQLLFVENGDLKLKLDAIDADVIDLSQILESEESFEHSDKTIQQTLQQNDKERTNAKVLCLSSFQKGFAFAIMNCVYAYERESKFRFERKTILKIKVDMYSEVSYRIVNIAINPQQDTIVATTLHAQIYVGTLFVPETLKAKELEFRILGEPLHTDEIIDLSLCSWKPIIMTASKDQTIRIWNYETEKTELVKKYQVDIIGIELHPSGILAAVGFSDQLRLMEIFIDDLKIMKTYNFPRCHSALFSNYGHFLAAAYNNLIAIISVFSFEVLKTLKGHNGTIRSVAWSNNDKYLVSAGSDGAVYQWDVESGERIHEVVQKGTEYLGVTLSTDMNSIYVVTNSGILREICNSEIVREIQPQSNGSLLSLTLSRSDQVMFMTSDKGHLYNVQLPFLEAGGGTCTNYRFFHSAITKAQITYDDTLLVTVSSRGTLAVWVIMNNSGKIAYLDADLGKCTEVLIPRRALLSKMDAINSLEVRMQQQVDEFQYQLEQSEIFHSEKLRDIHKGYGDAIEELKFKNEVMESSHIEELNVITSNIAETKEEHQRALQELEGKFHEKIIIEYEKSANITRKMDEMREDYEIKLRKSAGCLQDTIEALETDFKRQLQERQTIICQLMQELEDKKAEFIEYCRQVEIENDRNMVESQLSYERRLKDEQAATFKWRGETGVLKKKYTSMTKEAEDLREEIDTLKEEHGKYKTIISYYQRDMDGLRKEVEERDNAIGDKEKRINELQHKNQELEKYKQVLRHIIIELKAQIEPRERQIKEKRNQIAEMERELESSNQSILQLELQLSELKDKFHGSEVELKIERTRARVARNHISRICGDIYQVSGNIHRPDVLKDGIKKLYHKYSDNSELKKSFALDAEVQAEFFRQREHIEKLANNCKLKNNKKNKSSSINKLVNENVVLLEELNNLRRHLKDSRKQIANMESILGLGKKTLSAPLAKQKLDKACADYDEIERRHQAEVDSLRKIINCLGEENQQLRGELQNSIKN